MNWLFPAFLGGILAIALPIALHFLRRQPRRTIVFPSLRFLAAVQQRTEKRHRLLRLIVLTLRCLALALLAAAFARPFFGGTEAIARRTVVLVVDNSFSMQAKGRWGSLRHWARDQIGPVRAGDRFGLMTAGPAPEWRIPLTGDAEAVLSALEKLEPEWHTVRVEPALRLAAGTLAASSGTTQRIVFVGDHQRLSWTGANFTQPLAPGVTVEFPPLAEAVNRQAMLLPPILTRTTRGIRVSLAVRNFTAAQSRRLRVFRDRSATAEYDQALELGGGEARTLQIELPPGAPGAASFRFVLDEDDLPADDTVYAVAQAGMDQAVYLDAAPATSGADFVAAALDSTATIKPALSVQAPPGGVWSRRAVAVLRNGTSFSGVPAVRLETFLREGGSAVVFVDGSDTQRKWLERVARVSLRPIAEKDKLLVARDWAMDHPIVAAMAEHEVTPLLGWSFQNGWALPTSAVEALALWKEGAAAIGETRVGAGRLVLCGFAPDRREGDWPVHSAFVPFLHRSVTYLLGAASSAVAMNKVDQPLVLPVESGPWRALEGPAAGEPAQNVTSPVKPAKPGVYEFGTGNSRTLFAVNLAPEESDLEPWTEGAPWRQLSSPATTGAKAGGQRVSLARVEAEQRSPLWWWCVVAVALLLLTELGLANRTAR